MALINKLNADIKTRDKLIFGEYDPSKYIGGVRKFKNINAETLQKLVDARFADPEGTQNDSPELGEMLAFITKYPDYTVHGYTVIDTRDDYRVTVEGLSKDEPETDINILREFVDMNRWADEFEITTKMYCWYD